MVEFAQVTLSDMLFNTDQMWCQLFFLYQNNKKRLVAPRDFNFLAIAVSDCFRFVPKTPRKRGFSRGIHASYGFLKRPRSRFARPLSLDGKGEEVYCSLNTTQASVILAAGGFYFGTGGCFSNFLPSEPTIYCSLCLFLRLVVFWFSLCRSSS